MLGRTNPTFRQVLRRLENEWDDYKRALRLEDQKHFENLFKKADRNADAASHMNHFEPFNSFLLSVILEQEKELHEIRSACE